MTYNFKDLLSENKREPRIVVRNNHDLRPWSCDVSLNTLTMLKDSIGCGNFYVEVLP